MRAPIVIYHASCTDGFTSAWIARRALSSRGMTPEFFPMNYGEPIPLSPPNLMGRDIYILDFSLDAQAMEALLKLAKKVVLLDHHKTAQAALQPFLTSQEHDIRFDMTECGASLSWKYFFGTPIPRYIEYIRDRDLWFWKLPNSREFSAGLSAYPFDFIIWDSLFGDGVPEEDLLIQEGKTVLRYQQRLIDSAVANAVEVEFDGYSVLSVNTTVLNSEIGERLAKGRPFSMTYFIRSSDKAMVYSLRSDQDDLNSLDVSEIAKSHNGGGHKHAAGFTVLPTSFKVC